MDIFARLIETMDTQTAVYDKLLSLAREKQPVLIKGDITELDRITKAEEILILQVGRLEEQRKALHQQLASHFSLSPEELTLSELMKRADNKVMGKKMQQLFTDMTGKLSDLGEVNNTNCELVQNSLDFVNYSLNILANNDLTPGYGGQSEEKKSVAAKIFDRKV